MQTLLVLAHVFQSLLASAAITSDKRNWPHFGNSIQFLQSELLLINVK